jgi:multiple sugar transport system permease protein
MVAPGLALFAGLLWLPILATLYFSFTDYGILQSPTYTGLKNYAELFSDRIFQRAVAYTVGLLLVRVMFDA